MSGAAPDPLDRVAADMRERQGRGIQWTWYDTDVVLALVEVARAARDSERVLREITDRFIPGIDTWEDTDAEQVLADLRAALARLERTP